MEFKILTNPSDKDITNYPIAEANLDSSGNVVYDNQGNYEEGKQTLLWSIKAGEKKEIPAYVAKVLISRYAFLISEEKVETENEPSTVEKAEPVKGSITCKKCGQLFGNMRGLGLHLAIKHPEMLK